MTTICDALRKAVLQAAIQGRLTQQLPEDGNAEDLYKAIQTEKQKLIKEGKIKKEKPLPEITEDDIPFDIPENWKWVRLSELLIMQPSNGFSPKSITKETPYKKLTLTATTSGKFNDSWNYVDITDNQARKYYLKNNDLLIQRSNSREFVGTVCIYPGPDDVYIYPDLMMRMKSVDDVNLLYLYTALRAPTTKVYYSEKASGTSESMPKINQEIVKMTLVPLPPLAEQKRIVACIDNLMKKIDEMEMTEKDITALYNSFPGDMKASLLQAAIQGKLTAQLASDGDAETLYQDIQKEKQRLIKEGRIKKEKSLLEITEEEIPFDIPRNWKWVKQSDVCRLYTGNSISEHVKMKKYMRLDIDGYNYIGTKDVSFDHVINYENGVRIPTSEQGFKIAPEGASLICIEGGSAGKKVGFLSQPVCFGNKLCMFNPYLVEQKYIYYWLQSPTFLASFFEKMNGIIGGVKINALSNILMPLPPLAEQKRIVEKLDQILPLCDAMKAEIAGGERA